MLDAEYVRLHGCLITGPAAREHDQDGSQLSGLGEKGDATTDLCKTLPLCELTHGAVM